MNSNDYFDLPQVNRFCVCVEIMIYFFSLTLVNSFIRFDVCSNVAAIVNQSDDWTTQDVTNSAN